MKALVRSLLLLMSSLCLQAIAYGQVADPQFTTVNTTGAAWLVQIKKDGTVSPTTAAGGAGAIRLKAATVRQTVTLPAGLFEFTVQARGQGELLLKVDGAGERTQMLGKDWHTCGYLFEIKPGPATISIGVAVDGVVTAAKILPADAAQKAAWAREQESLQQLGFITASAQRPAPGSESLQVEGALKLLDAMTLRAVLDEPRMNTGHVKNEQRLVHWLGENGFTRLDGETLEGWMRERIAHEDAYGSVVILCRGVAPANLMEGPDGNPLWLQYLRAGGRIVNVGDLPFHTAEQPNVKPTVSNGNMNMSCLGLRIGWNSPYWGKGDLAMTKNPAAAGWEFDTLGSSITGFAVESVTLAFDLFTSPVTGKPGAGSWFKNVRPDLPWSGLIKMQQNFDGNNDAALRDIWRAAHYVGKPLTIPALPPRLTPAVARLTLETTTGKIVGRREFVRGETVTCAVTLDAALQATSVQWILAQGEKTLASGAVEPGVTFTLNTAPYTYGEYTLRLSAMKGAEVVETRTERIGIRYIAPAQFHWEMWHSAGSNLLRSDLECADIRQAGMELYLVEPSLDGMDLATRHGMGFSLRAHPDLADRRYDYAKHPEVFRVKADGQPRANAFSGGRPALGISHPKVREDAFRAIAESVSHVADHPAFRPYVLTNDDFSQYYGADYAQHVLDGFKASTGLEAPRIMELPARYGAIPDNTPWLRWYEYTLDQVGGAFNKAEADGARHARADVRVGPIPGGMMIPLVQLWEPSQYPVYHFGKKGFNLISSYYYNSYWQPVMTATFWMEIGRMGNRDLPEWNMPDVMYTAGYTRNNFFHYLAGGVQGLAYFRYAERTEDAWDELKKLGQVVQTVGPVQVKLKPARRAIGMLNSLSTNCYDPGHTLVQVYGYHNLMQGHFDLEMVAEEEIVAGRAEQYQAIVLYNIKYLRQSVYDALAAYAAKGGLVLLDTSVPFDIPGAKRLGVDLGMGTQRTLPFPAEGAHASTPGINDYGHAERITVIQQEVSQFVKPWFECPDPKITATRFENEGVSYAWFVNVQDAQEYQFCRPRFTGNLRTAKTMQEVRAWEAAELAKGPYTTTIILPTLSGVPYDLLAQKKVPVTRIADGRYRLQITMERFGGTLIAFYPEEIQSVRLEAPARVNAGEAMTATITVLGKQQPMRGAVTVECVLLDPNGRKSDCSGTRATTNGMVTFAWTPAVNDARGTWTLQVTELASGKRTEKRIQMQ